MAKITVYTTETCPKCNKLKNYLQENKIPFEVSDMSTPEALTELMFHEVFTNTAPVLQIGERFLTHEEIFEKGEVKEGIFKGE